MVDDSDDTSAKAARVTRGPASEPSAGLTIERTFVLTFAIISALAAVSNQIRIGSLRTPEVGGLLFNPGPRFSDLQDVVRAAVSGVPYGQVTSAGTTTGPAYPPGVLPLMLVFDRLGVEGAKIAVITATAITLAVLCAIVLNRGRARYLQVTSAMVALSAVIATSLVLDYYAAVVVIAGAIAAAAITAGGRVPLLRAMATPVVLGTSMPLIFAIDRLNVDILVMQCMAIAASLIAVRRRTTAAVVIGVAIALKTYPVWYLIADTHRPGRWGRIVLALITGAGLSLWGLSTTAYSYREALAAFNRSVQYFEQVYVIQESGMPYGASFLTSLRILYRDAGHADHAAFVSSIYPDWKALAPVAVAIVAAIAIAADTPAWCRLLTVICALMIFSPNTGMYRAAVLVVPIAMWLFDVTARGAGHRLSRWEVAMAIAAGAGLAPLTFWAIRGFEIIYLTSQTVLAPFVYGALMGTALIVGMQRRGLLLTRADDSRGDELPVPAS